MDSLSILIALIVIYYIIKLMWKAVKWLWFLFFPPKPKPDTAEEVTKGVARVLGAIIFSIFFGGE